MRDLGHEGSITLVGNEAQPPYQRPPLSKAYLLGEMTADRLYLRPEDFYRQKSIDLRLSTYVEAIDRDRREVVFGDGGRLPYARLVLATGSRPRHLPVAIGGALAGVYYVRNLADIDAMATEFQPGRRVLVVGGGYIGLEVAAVSSKLALKVTLIESAPRILQRVASVQTASFFQHLHRDHGVEIWEGVEVAMLTGVNGRVTKVTLKDGRTLDADFVIVGIGVHPNVELAQAAGFEIDNGIKVDAQCRTSDPFVFAAGDCASFPWRDQRIRLESVGNAIDQGEAVAKAIVLASECYAAKPWFWSDQFDTKLQIVGLAGGHDLAVVRKSSETALSIWHYRGDELLAVDAINQPAVFMVSKRLIEAGKSPDPKVVTNLNIDLKSLLHSTR
ncbi:pyridine nucleotide-disulfide oxidoreductase [Mesorhizobium loti]|uniref:Pyridine nucleotide-disulfide oxidoreductase n=1 Tax=Rhizobium loti TaxID=381 RepID=A0A101KP54_RHILI|nr:pyridine nucleotide-disulfide oxidoreductase [Mesorhizobium loti]